MASRRRYLVAYDIRDDKRLPLVYKTMKGYGWRMQYSVFVCDLDRIELLSLKTDLGAIIHHAVLRLALHCATAFWMGRRYDSALSARGS